MVVQAPPRFKFSRPKYLVDTLNRLSIRAYQWPNWEFSVKVLRFGASPQTGSDVLEFFLALAPTDQEFGIRVIAHRWHDDVAMLQSETTELAISAMQAILLLPDWDDMAQAPTITLYAIEGWADSFGQRASNHVREQFQFVSSRPVEKPAKPD